MSASDSDLDLASRACDGDRAAFAEIVGRHGTSVFSFLIRRVETVQDAEDMFQATCLRAWMRMEEFDPRRGSLLAWLLVIAGSQARDAARVSRRWRRAASTRGSGAVAEPPPAAAASTAWIWGLVERTLTREQASAVWLRYAEDLTPSQIARVLGRTPVGVRVMLMRALARVRAELAREGRSDLADLESGPDECRGLNGGRS